MNLKDLVNIYNKLKRVLCKFLNLNKINLKVMVENQLKNRQEI